MSAEKKQIVILAGIHYLYVKIINNKKGPLKKGLSNLIS
ncbi:MAG: hypothetical protein UT42_C0047G0004 [Candidatus Falkowbacteria bacterium GW2011_GWA2_39_24]|uniref:Uncharacterized protein n=1 Tax=Candidatus Falkowbacteria bacterium GW2011_GWA2_39_24 TaxID=1618634 RepID=A0A0G0NB13_9BACT|nr:MAG: hypothetical protein UT42_C0047G0004 [Candidatus Falkowbacteria bacterium GW2011_GWA2_39_24]